MHHTVHHHARRRLLLGAVVLLMVRGGVLHAQESRAGTVATGDTATAEAVTTDALTTLAFTAEAVVFIGHVTPDGYPDTVLGAKTVSGYLPTRIVWGRPAHQKPGKLRETVFRYPAWQDLRGSVTFQSINSDALTDIVLHLHERTEQGGEETETLHSLVIFGQHGLDSLPVIVIGEIRRFQAKPFFAMELAVGSELTEPGTRDLSGSTSYILEPVKLDLRPHAAPAHAAPAGGVPPGAVGIVAGTDGEGGSAEHQMREHRVRLSPNPAGEAVSIEVSGVQPGEYVVRLVSVTGAEEVGEHVRITEPGMLHHTLDVRNVPSGYYVVSIEPAAGEPVGACPLIITR